MPEEEEEDDRLPLTYAVCEVTVAVLAVVGNLLVVATFAAERKLRRVTGLYIISLAASDLLVGLVGVPSALLTRLGLPKHAFHLCLLMLSALVLLCTVSILNLVAVTADRYWAILHPFCYRRAVTRRTAARVIAGCWALGTLVGLLPLLGWNGGEEEQGRCLFIPVMHYDFLVLIFFATIAYPALLMAFCYGRIYAVVIKQLRQIRALEQQLPRDGSARDGSSSSRHLHASGSASSSERSLQQRTRPLPEEPSPPPAASRREVRTAKNLAIIVIFFMICWIPLYTLNCVQAFCTTCRAAPLWLTDAFIVLSHLNSALNPFLYAYHMSDFRNALKRRLFHCCRSHREGVESGTKPRPLEMVALSAPALAKIASIEVSQGEARTQFTDLN